MSASTKAIHRVEEWFGRWCGNPQVAADFDIVLALARRAASAERALYNIAHMSRACSVDDALNEARAALSPRTKRGRGK